MLKVHILTTCSFCNGAAYLPIGEETDYQGNTYMRYAPCTMCEGTGNRPTWVSLPDFLEMLNQAQCQHEHTSLEGGMHFTAGDVWDDIHEVCVECGANLDEQTVGDFILDED